MHFVPTSFTEKPFFPDYSAVKPLLWIKYSYTLVPSGLIFYWSVYLPLYQYLHYSNYSSSIKSIDILYFKYSGLILLHVVLVIFCPLNLHTNFRINLTVSKKYFLCDFDWDGTESIDQLGRTDILTVLHLLINIRGKCTLHLFSFFKLNS